MPRNASGTFSLVSGNPVVSGTLIDATWANNTLNDIANEMTDSLSRSGEGGMLAPLRLTDGVQATPGLGFTNEPGSGIYRAGTNEWWSVAGGAQVQQHTANGAVTRFAAGAVGTPSLSAFGDVNTGLWFPAADTIAASVGGVESFRVNSSGNMGIGTSSPGARLDVSGLTSTTTFRATSNTASSFVSRLTNSDFQLYALNGVAGNNSGDIKATIGLYFADNIANLSSGIHFARGSAATNGWLNFVTNGAETMRLDSSGNLGIGTSSPASKLHVNNATGIITYATIGNLNGGTQVGVDAAGASVLSSFAVNGIRFGQQSGTTFAETMRLDSSGNLGIGTSSPGSRLEVNGTSNLGGTAAAPRVGVGTFAAGVASMNAGGGNALQIGTTGASEMALFQNNAAIVRLLGSNMGLRTIDCGASAVGCFGIANATTVPTGAPAGGGVIYVEAGALKYRGSSGTVTTIANA